MTEEEEIERVEDPIDRVNQRTGLNIELKGKHPIWYLFHVEEDGTKKDIGLWYDSLEDIRATVNAIDNVLVLLNKRKGQWDMISGRFTTGPMSIGCTVDKGKPKGEAAVIVTEHPLKERR